jgi:hypothetical protein
MSEVTSIRRSGDDEGEIEMLEMSSPTLVNGSWTCIDEQRSGWRTGNCQSRPRCGTSTRSSTKMEIQSSVSKTQQSDVSTRSEKREDEQRLGRWC